MKILAIDDQPEVLKYIVKALQEAEDIEGPGAGHPEVTPAETFEEALRLLDERRFDAVTIDMINDKTQEQDGLQVLRKLSEKTPITIVYTAHPDMRNCVEAMRAGAWDYLEKYPEDSSKPFEKLVNSLRKACEHRKKNPDAGRYNPDFSWLQRNLATLSRDYPGETIAVLDKQVVDHDTDYNALMNRVAKDIPLAHALIFDIPNLEKERV